MSDDGRGSTAPHHVMAASLDPMGFVRLTWVEGARITEQLADEAMALVDRTNAGQERPLLVTMARTTTLTRGARRSFTRKCSASRIALLGRSQVDRVIANFAMGTAAPPQPTRFFTSEPAAVAWLCDGDASA